MSNQSLLFSAYQKLYSALRSLDKFNTQNDFFDNISSLDTFFSEFRNVTFVLQKSLAHTQYLSDYEDNRDKYFSKLKWFIDKRNETIKQQPFQLKKEVKIIEYFPYGNRQICSHIFSVDDDKDLSLLLADLKYFFLTGTEVEYFFSVEFTFFENNDSINIHDTILLGVKAMREFLVLMESFIGIKCELCEKIKEKITKINFLITPKNIFNITDYIYYPKCNEFVIGEYQTLRLAAEGDFYETTVPRMGISEFYDSYQISNDLSYFQKFVFIHIIQQNVELMPAFVFVYEDDTTELDTYNSTIKTTFYRIIYNIHKRIISDNVKEVYLMSTYTHYKYKEDLLYMTSEERKETNKKFDQLTFVKINNKCEVFEYRFSEDELLCLQGCVHKLKNSDSTDVKTTIFNILPILEAFRIKNEQ